MIYELERKDDRIFIDENCAMVTAKFMMDGKCIEPLYVHPWDESEVEKGILKYLKGDFVCVPFGITPAENVEGYIPENKLDATEYAHGLSSNGIWHACEKGEDNLTLDIEYKDHPYIKKMIRKVGFLENKQGINLENKVMVNKDFSTTVGCHPIFKLNEQPKSMKLVLPEVEFFATYPKKCEQTSITKQGQFFDGITKVPLADGNIEDFSLLPLDYNTEEIIMLCGVKEGKVRLENKQEGYAVILEFDKSVFKNCLLWYSNKGRDYAPWNSRNLCLGIEPITAPFDFGHDIAVSKNELSKRKVETSIKLKKDKGINLDYHIYIEKL